MTIVVTRTTLMMTKMTVSVKIGEIVLVGVKIGEIVLVAAMVSEAVLVGVKIGAMTGRSTST
jgi:hypothetical protein